MAGGLIFQPVAFPRQHGDAIWTSLSYAEENIGKKMRFTVRFKFALQWLTETDWRILKYKMKVNKKVTLMGVNLG